MPPRLPAPNNLTDLSRKLADAEVLVARLDKVARRIWIPSTRRMLLSLKDDIAAALAEARTKVQKEKDVEKALRATITADQAQTTALMDRIAELQAQPGVWTDADMSEILGGIKELNTALDPDTVVADVLAGTGVAGSTGT